MLLYLHHNDVIMGTMVSQITSLTIVYSAVYSGADQRKHQSSASLAFVWRIHRGPVNSPHKWPVTRKMFPFDDVIMCTLTCQSKSLNFLHLTTKRVHCFKCVIKSGLFITRFNMRRHFIAQEQRRRQTLDQVWSCWVWGFFIFRQCQPRA